MHLADHVKPISYLKSEAARIVKDLTDSGGAAHHYAEWW